MKTLHEACMVINWVLAALFVATGQPALATFAMGNAILNCILAEGRK